MKKKILALLLTLAMALSLTACGGQEETSDTPADEGGETSQGETADIKVGLICVHDQNSGYDVAHIDGLTAACEALGIDPTDEQIHEMAQGAVDARGGDHAGAFMELHVEDIENILKNAR